LGAWVLILLSVKSEDCWIIEVQGNCETIPDGCIGLSVIPVDWDFSIDKSNITAYKLTPIWTYCLV